MLLTSATPLMRLGTQRQLAALEHGGHDGDVLQQGAAAQLVLHDQADL